VSFWDLTIATAGVSFRILSRPNAPWALRLMGGGKRRALSNADQGRPWYLWKKGTPHAKATRLDQVNSSFFFKPNLILKSKVGKQKW